MSAQSLGGSPALASLREQARAWWQGRTPRERVAVQAVAAVLVFFVFWSLLVQPAWRAVRTAPAQIAQLDSRLEQMKRIATESAGLRGTPPVSTAQAAAALRAATVRLGDKAKLSVVGDRATLTLTGADADALRNWLQDARSAARARPVEAQLQRAGEGYSGSLVLSLGAGT